MNTPRFIKFRSIPVEIEIRADTPKHAADKPDEVGDVAQAADLAGRVGITNGKTQVYAGGARVFKLNVGRIGDDAGRSEKLQGDAVFCGGLVSQPREPLVGDTAVQRAAAVEVIHRYGGPAADGGVKPALKVGRIARQDDVQTDGRIRLNLARGEHRTAQVELLPDAGGEKNGRRGPVLRQFGRDLSQAGAAAPVIGARAADHFAVQFLVRRLVDAGAADFDAEIARVRGASYTDVDIECFDGVDFRFFLRGGGVVRLGADDAGQP